MCFVETIWYLLCDLSGFLYKCEFPDFLYKVIKYFMIPDTCYDYMLDDYDNMLMFMKLKTSEIPDGQKCPIQSVKLKYQ